MGTITTRRRTALIVAGIAAILLLALVFLLPALINVNRYRPQMVTYLQEKTGKQVEIGHLALAFFPLSLRIDDFGVKNPPLFPSGYIVKVARIDAELSVAALLHRQVVVKSVVMDGQGSLKAGLLRFGAVEVKGMESKLRLEARRAFFTDVKAQVYGGSAAGELSFDLSRKNASFNSSVRLSGVNVAHLLAAFPNGGGKMTGKMEGDVKLAGEIAHSLRPLAG